ncbi:NifU family protein [Tessaracoccus sp. OS52]|uniref:NifU family protein n=1 Tax=Tessaracoccus sp. OS52 TaxID=2886691 RepID=UPI001D105105|nr:NifU family protein [Tessaracoccus sp. OS52]MCC2593681.1 NifU family protein [Tessaracoccus sp. OS52]
MSLPIHAESVVGDPWAVRWVVEAGSIAVGEVSSAPGQLGSLLRDGVLSELLVERGGVWSWLADGLDWAVEGPRVRQAVQSAVQLDGWVTVRSARLLELVARDVIEVQQGGYIASHGGVIGIAAVEQDSLVLDLGGACRDCPAAGRTLNQRIERSVRARYPELATVSRCLPALRGPVPPVRRGCPPSLG